MSRGVVVSDRFESHVCWECSNLSSEDAGLGSGWTTVCLAWPLLVFHIHRDLHQVLVDHLRGSDYEIYLL